MLLHLTVCGYNEVTAFSVLRSWYWRGHSWELEAVILLPPVLHPPVAPLIHLRQCWGVMIGALMNLFALLLCGCRLLFGCIPSITLLKWPVEGWLPPLAPDGCWLSICEMGEFCLFSSSGTPLLGTQGELLEP